MNTEDISLTLRKIHVRLDGRIGGIAPKKKGTYITVPTWEVVLNCKDSMITEPHIEQASLLLDALKNLTDKVERKIDKYLITCSTLQEEGNTEGASLYEKKAEAYKTLAYYLRGISDTKKKEYKEYYG